MKNTWNIRRKDDAVSPVIATILMVAITVVLAAVLYVMVIGFGGDTNIDTPLGMNVQNKNQTSVTILISDAPTDAKITSTSVSVTHDGSPTAVTNVTVYSSAGSIIAVYTGTWSYYGGKTADTAEFASGMTIVVNAAAISAGDQVVFSSSESYYGTTTVTVN